jgi:hypothetical protein
MPHIASRRRRRQPKMFFLKLKKTCCMFTGNSGTVDTWVNCAAHNTVAQHEIPFNKSSMCVVFKHSLLCNVFFVWPDVTNPAFECEQARLYGYIPNSLPVPITTHLYNQSGFGSTKELALSIEKMGVPQLRPVIFWVLHLGVPFHLTDPSISRSFFTSNFRALLFCNLSSRRRTCLNVL